MNTQNRNRLSVTTLNGSGRMRRGLQPHSYPIQLCGMCGCGHFCLWYPNNWFGWANSVGVANCLENANRGECSGWGWLLSPSFGSYYVVTSATSWLYIFLISFWIYWNFLEFFNFVGEILCGCHATRNTWASGWGCAGWCGGDGGFRNRWPRSRWHEYEFGSWAGLKHTAFRAGLKWRQQWLILPQGFWVPDLRPEKSCGGWGRWWQWWRQLRVPHGLSVSKRRAERSRGPLGQGWLPCPCLRGFPYL